ncbi:MAG: hypothetical protein SF123_04190 [Chloroflexota bacterium]|nr:hypothetical protein [Chloroflexota bacterium]
MQFSKGKASSDVVRDVLDALQYDFNEFELTHFANHIADHRRKPIAIISLAMTSTLHGIWIPAQTHDYIFCNALLQPVHRTHVVLHELAHLMLGHGLQPIREVLPPSLIQELGGENTLGRLRAAPTNDAHADDEERESERFVYLIQRKLVRVNRLAELTRESSSIPGLKPITDAMGYTGK